MTTLFPLDGGAEREHFAVLSDQIIDAVSWYHESPWLPFDYLFFDIQNQVLLAKNTE